MSKLRQRIVENYADGEELVSVLQKHKIIDLAERAISKIEEVISIGKPKQLSNISGMFLTSINSRIKNIEDIKEKEKIEYLLSDIFICFIRKLFIMIVFIVFLDIFLSTCLFIC